VLTRFSDIPPEEIQWLWQGRIARGKLTLIAGDPGFGKSLLTIDLAARVSTGADWPDFPIPAPLGDTVMLSVEDGRADTIRPRLDAAGADCTRVLHLEGATIGDDGKSRPRTLSFKRDMEALEDALKSLPECRLVIVDPISAYLDDTDSHKNADVRGLLAPLAELAERLKIAVVLIQHLNKGGTGANALYRPMGSLAFVAAARAAYIVTKDKNNADRRMMLPAKNNLAKDTTELNTRNIR
jgi:RecA-family ATPase